MKKMKHQILITALLILSITTSGISQSVKLKHSLSFEIIPVSYMMTVGSGLNIQYAFESKKRFLSLVSAGFMYNNFNTGHEREFFTSNGVPLAKWSTEVDINTTRPYPLGGIVNSNDFQNLDKLGFKQFKAKMGYRLNRYLSYELLYKLSKRKLQFYAGGGITLGMTNSDETHVGFSGNIKKIVNIILVISVSVELNSPIFNLESVNILKVLCIVSNQC